MEPQEGCTEGLQRALESGRGLDRKREGWGKPPVPGRELKGEGVHLPTPPSVLPLSIHPAWTSILPTGTEGARGPGSRLSPSSM